MRPSCDTQDGSQEAAPTQPRDTAVLFFFSSKLMIAEIKKTLEAGMEALSICESDC